MNVAHLASAFAGGLAVGGLATLHEAGVRDELAERFTDPGVRRNVEIDLTLLDHYDPLITKLELELTRSAKVHDAQMFFLLRSIPGVGKILALVIMYEIYDICRFDTVGKFVSDGKPAGKGGSKMGNVHLKWAFSEAVPLFMRENQDAKKFVARMEKKFGKGKAMSILAARLGRAVYWMLKRKEAFDVDLFFAKQICSKPKTH